MTSAAHTLSPLDAQAVSSLLDAATYAVIAINGEPGSGRSTVGRRLAGRDHEVVTAEALATHLVAEHRAKRDPSVPTTRNRVMDEIGWLAVRARTLGLLRLFPARRVQEGLPTVLVEGRRDGSLQALLDGIGPHLRVAVTEPSASERERWVQGRAAEAGLTDDAPVLRKARAVSPWSFSASRSQLIEATARKSLR